jgi:GNAT superfamily N-acetyltransferase
MESAETQLVEFGRLSIRDWAQLIGRDRTPFGSVLDALDFRPKDHHIGVRGADGRLVAAIGWSIVTVEVEGHGEFEVIGTGALYVRPELRGQHLAARVMDRVAQVTDLLEPQRMMLFCEPHMEDVYRRLHQCMRITDPVWVDQAAGAELVPLRAMWRRSPRTSAVQWPAGTVKVHGLPF